MGSSQQPQNIVSCEALSGLMVSFIKHTPLKHATSEELLCFVYMKIFYRSVSAGHEIFFVSVKNFIFNYGLCIEWALEYYLIQSH